MARFDVTPELASVIKSTRISHNITAKSVAEQIGKSQAYISKLEKGELKSIDQKQLITIFEYILGSETAFQDFLNETLLPIFSTLTLRHSKEEIDQQLWYKNFDTILRLIPIPEALIKNIIKEMDDYSVDVNTLVERINSNEMMVHDGRDLSAYPSNTWFIENDKGTIKSVYIKMCLEAQTVSDILSFKIKSTNYMTMFAIVFYLLLFEQYGNSQDLEKDDYSSTWRKAQLYLNQYHFYSLEEKSYLESKAKTESEIEALMSDFDRDNLNTLNDIIRVFKVYSDVDIIKTTKYLSKFKKNLDWDGGFILSLISLGFYSLDNTTTAQRQNILFEISDIVKKYKSLPVDNNAVEFYD